jgi:predicted metal-dependent phosphoesterase TrpH
MNDLVDLHIHSNKSCDGDFPPADLIRLAKDQGFRAMSISDHDTVAAYPGACESGRKEGVEIIPSVEFTTLFDGREFHLLLPFMDWEKEVVGDLVARATRARLGEAGERVRKLREAGFDISWEEVESASESIPPLGVKIAQILLEKAARTGKQNDPSLKRYFEARNLMFAPYEFYKDHFTEGKEAYVPKRHIPVLEILELAPETGGVPVLSHPGAYFQQTTRDDLFLLKDKGLQGIEVYTSYHEPDQAQFYLSLAHELDLVPTAGSDFHGRIKPHIPFGFIRDGGYCMVEALRARRSG